MNIQLHSTLSNKLPTDIIQHIYNEYIVLDPVYEEFLNKECIPSTQQYYNLKNLALTLYSTLEGKQDPKLIILGFWLLVTTNDYQLYYEKLQLYQHNTETNWDRPLDYYEFNKQRFQSLLNTTLIRQLFIEYEKVNLSWKRKFQKLPFHSLTS